MKKVLPVVRKSFNITPSGRSTDFIAPSFGYGCLFNCTYCYMKRHLPEGLKYATNIGDILTAINNHVTFLPTKEANQTHAEYYTYDIGCNEDFALHAKYYDWVKIFNFFVENSRAMASFATKYVNYDLLNFAAKKKVRIRFSLIPPRIRRIVEPSTSPINERLFAVSKFLEAGYEVHLNFSPVIVYQDWLKDYEELFDMVDFYVPQEAKKEVKAEVIFLTHNESKHVYNLKNELPGENLLWVPGLQEQKTSNNREVNLRYKRELKKEFINQFTKLHSSIIPWNTIRYKF